MIAADNAAMVTASRWVYVCRVNEIVPNTGVCAKVGDDQVAVFRVCADDDSADQIYALSNLDPKSGANVQGPTGSARGPTFDPQLLAGYLSPGSPLVNGTPRRLP